MKSEFIENANTRKFFEICSELSDPASMIGPSLAMVTGPAGRGKTEAARRFATQTEAIYLPPLNTRTPTMVLREIAFELACGPSIVPASRSLATRSTTPLDHDRQGGSRYRSGYTGVNRCPILLIGDVA